MLKPIITDIARDSLELIIKYDKIFSSYGFKYEEVQSTQNQSRHLHVATIKIKSLPESNDNIFEESDFHNLVTTVRNYDADKETQKYVKTHQ